MQFTDVVMTAKAAILVMQYTLYSSWADQQVHGHLFLLSTYVLYLPGMKVSCVSYLIVFAIEKPPLPLQKKHHLILLYKAN